MKYRIGRITTGVTVVILGILLFLSQLTDQNWITDSVKFWPFILIGYGIEYLWHARNRERSSFDVGGAILVFFLVVILTGFSFFSRYIFNFDDMDYVKEDTPIYFSTDEVDSLNVKGTVGRIIVEASQENRIMIVPTYRSSSERSLESMKEEVGVNVRLQNGQLVIEEKRGTRLNFIGFSRTGVDLHIYAPSDLSFRASENVGSIEVFGMEKIESLNLDIGDILVKDSKGNADINSTIGKIKVTHFVGTLNVDHTIGEVLLDGEMNGKWDVDSTIGKIEFTIPKEHSYTYDVDVTIGAGSGKGSVNGGQYLLQADLTIGDVKINHK